ncbi:MAG: FAD-binding oxidoreductase [Gemmobacter sp.]|nr:FAD-binding oxidoreductase [Gemmobacter sp.]
MDADVIVIGGGVAGLTLAAKLAEGRARVLVLEAEGAVGYHTSGRSAALYEPTYGKPAVRDLSIASGEWYHASGLLSPRGLMILGRDEERDLFEHDLAAMGMDRLPLDEAFARVPVLRRDVVTLAGYHGNAWDIDTDRLLQESVRTIRAGGGTVRLNARVSAIARQGGGWATTVADEVLTAPVLVNAAGSWANVVAGMAGVAGPQFQPYRRSMARIPAPGGHDTSRWPMIFGAGETWYAKPDAGALIVSPAEEHPMDPHDAWADDLVLAEGLARYEAFVTEPVTRVVSNWAGLRTFAPDRVLVIGPDPVAPGFYWQAGQGGYGFQTAPAASRLGADLILGRPPEAGAALASAVSPARFA